MYLILDDEYLKTLHNLEVQSKVFFVLHVVNHLKISILLHKCLQFLANLIQSVHGGKINPSVLVKLPSFIGIPLFSPALRLSEWWGLMTLALSKTTFGFQQKKHFGRGIVFCLLPKTIKKINLDCLGALRRMERNRN